MADFLFKRGTPEESEQAIAFFRKLLEVGKPAVEQIAAAYDVEPVREWLSRHSQPMLVHHAQEDAERAMNLLRSIAGIADQYESDALRSVFEELGRLGTRLAMIGLAVTACNAVMAAQHGGAVEIHVGCSGKHPI